jgi:hypothetical protein
LKGKRHHVGAKRLLGRLYIECKLANALRIDKDEDAGTAVATGTGPALKSQPRLDFEESAAGNTAWIPVEVQGDIV